MLVALAFKFRVAGAAVRPSVRLFRSTSAEAMVCTGGWRVRSVRERLASWTDSFPRTAAKGMASRGEVLVEGAVVGCGEEDACVGNRRRTPAVRKELSMSRVREALGR